MSQESLEEYAERLFASARSERARAVVREQTLSRMLVKQRAPRAWPSIMAATVLAAAAGAALVVSLERSQVPSIGAERLRRELTAHGLDSAAEKPLPPLVPAPDIPNPERRTSGTVLHAKTPAPKPMAPSVAPLTLEEETSALEKVQDELRSGKPGAALAALDDYERAARNKHLTAEATLLRIQALAASGRAPAASVLAERFVSAYPHSPLVDRARRYLIATDDGGSEPSEDPGR